MEEESFLRDKAVRCTVTEGDESHDDKRREYVANVTPVDLRNLPNHHASHLQQSKYWG